MDAPDDVNVARRVGVTCAHSPSRLVFPRGMISHVGTVYEAPRPVEPLLSTQEAAGVLGVSLRTVFRLLDDGELARDSNRPTGARRSTVDSRLPRAAARRAVMSDKRRPSPERRRLELSPLAYRQAAALRAVASATGRSTTTGIGTTPRPIRGTTTTSSSRLRWATTCSSARAGRAG